MAGPVVRINIDLTDEEEVRRAAERFLEIIRLAKRFQPPESVDPAILEEIRRGAELFERALKLAQFIRHHGSFEDLTPEKVTTYYYLMHYSRKERDMR